MEAITKAKERPILFSTPMVIAVDECRKDVTRRITGGLKKINESPDDWELYGSNSSETGMVFNHPKAGDWSACFRNKLNGEVRYIKSPYGGDGDVLWLRETFFKNGDEYIYLANGTCCEQFEQCECSEIGRPKWKPSIHMPRIACRTRLYIVSIDVGRLHDITEDEAFREGVGAEDDEDYNAAEHYSLGGSPIQGGSPARFAFIALWQRINGVESWNANPWVWRIEFKKVEE